MKKRKVNPYVLKDFLTNSTEAPSTTGVTQDNFEAKLAHCLSFYQRNYDIKNARNFLIELKPDLSCYVTSLSESNFNNFKTLGFVCKFILEHKLPEDFHEKTYLWMNQKVEELKAFKKTKKDSGEPVTKPLVSEENKLDLQKVITDKALEYVWKIDEYVDEFRFNKKVSNFNVVEYLKDSDLSGLHARKIHHYFEKDLNELNSIEGDEQLKEAYGFLIKNKKRMKETKAFYIKLLGDIESFIELTSQRKKQVKPPTKVSIQKQLAKVSFLKESAEFNIASVVPEKILGSSIVVLYNERYKKLTILRGDNMTISGTTIQNFNEKESKMKVLRNPSIFVPQFKKASKTGLKKLWEEVRTNEHVANGRLGDTTLILNVFD